MIAAERETTITINDADSLVRIWTCRAADIRQLRAKLDVIQEACGIYADGTEWASFTVDSGRFSAARGVRGRRPMTDAQRAAVVANLANARAKAGAR